MRATTLLSTFSALLLAAACSETTGTPVGDGGEIKDATNEAAQSGSDGSADSQATDAQAADDGAQDGDADAGDSGFPCPDERGAYSIQLTGAGCGDTLASAPQCIQQSACSITLSSQGVNGSALNGSTPIQSDGSFSQAAITEGTVQRTGCTATWDSATSVLVVDCGGVGSSQSCVATLTRSSTTCN